MGVLFSKVWQAFFSYDEFKVIIVGLNNAGKTTTLYKLYGQLPHHHHGTSHDLISFLFVCLFGRGGRKGF
jgi:GTPase SAR1 family protein